MSQYNNFTLITDIKQIEIENISYIYNSDETTFIINNENEIFVMGDNTYGQLGLGNTINTYEFSNFVIWTGSLFETIMFLAINI